MQCGRTLRHSGELDLFYLYVYTIVLVNVDNILINNGLGLTWVVSCDPRRAAEHLPAQRAVLPAVINKHPLKSLGPVQLIQDDWGCRAGGEERRGGQRR
jgi:hypothetical protein